MSLVRGLRYYLNLGVLFGTSQVLSSGRTNGCMGGYAPADSDALSHTHP